MTLPSINQTVIGDHNIFTGTGDIKVVYELAPLETEDRRNLIVLLERVKAFWTRDPLASSVQPVTLQFLSKKTLPDAVEHPWKMMLGSAEQVSQEIPPDKSISEIFDDMGRLLLILGEPGSGKTTTLLELTRKLIDSASDNPTKPIPVVFHLSSWSEKRQPILDWLVEELRTKYYIPRRLGQSFLRNNRLLLLLDGLDEVVPAHQSSCVEAINSFAREVGTPGMVVCCRLNEYLGLTHRLAFNGAVFLNPLSFQQVDASLEERGAGLAALRTLLHEDPTLQTLATSPLMLDVMVTAYNDLPIEALRDERLSTARARRENVFHTYVTRMFDRKTQAGEPYSREQSLSWMSLLAKNMSRHSQSIFLVERIQPSWLLSRRQLLVYLFCSRLAAALVLGVALGLPLLFNGWPISERLGYVFLLMVWMFTMGVFATLLKLRWSKKWNEPVASQPAPSRWRVVLYVLGFVVAGGLLGSSLAAIGGSVWLTLHLETLNPRLGLTGAASVWHDAITIFPFAKPWGHKLLFVMFFVFWGFIFGIIYGLLFGLLIGAKDRKRHLTEDIQTAETLSWSGARAKTTVKRVVLWVMLTSALAGALTSPFALLWVVVTRVETPTMFFKGFLFSAALSLYVFLVFALILSLALGALGALLGGLNASPRVETKRLTNQGIRTSFKNSIWAGIIVAIILAILDLVWKLIGYKINRLTGSQWGIQQLVIADLLRSFVLFGFTYGMLAVLGYGGIDIIKHYILRLILFLKGNGPRRFDSFLERAVKLGFMHRVGGGYIFIHSLLRNYFEERLTTQKQTWPNPPC